jgi:hypothetical protein
VFTLIIFGKEYNLFICGEMGRVFSTYGEKKMGIELWWESQKEKDQ